MSIGTVGRICGCTQVKSWASTCPTFSFLRDLVQHAEKMLWPSCAVCLLVCGGSTKPKTLNVFVGPCLLNEPKTKILYVCICPWLQSWKIHLPSLALTMASSVWYVQLSWTADSGTICCILTKIIVLTEFVFHLKNLSAACIDDTHKTVDFSGGGSIYIYIYVHNIYYTHLV